MTAHPWNLMVLDMLGFRASALVQLENHIDPLVVNRVVYQERME